MGSFYSNIHLRVQDRQLVERAWQSYWEGREETSWVMVVTRLRAVGQRLRLALRPAGYGWVDRISPRIFSRRRTASRSPSRCRTAQLAEYWLFNHGNEVDHYTSE